MKDVIGRKNKFLFFVVFVPLGFLFWIFQYFFKLDPHVRVIIFAMSFAFALFGIIFLVLYLIDKLKKKR